VICHGNYFLSLCCTRIFLNHKRKVIIVQVVHPYIELNLDHLKITKIKRNTHMTNESKNLESDVFT
jgi:hypothetical protein